jgi:hypothetical protein
MCCWCVRLPRLAVGPAMAQRAVQEVPAAQQAWGATVASSPAAGGVKRQLGHRGRQGLLEHEVSVPL